MNVGGQIMSKWSKRMEKNGLNPLKTVQLRIWVNETHLKPVNPILKEVFTHKKSELLKIVDVTVFLFPETP